MKGLHFDLHSQALPSLTTPAFCIALRQDKPWCSSTEVPKADDISRRLRSNGGVGRDHPSSSVTTFAALTIELAYLLSDSVEALSRRLAALTLRACPEVTIQRRVGARYYLRHLCGAYPRDGLAAMRSIQMKRCIDHWWLFDLEEAWTRLLPPLRCLSLRMALLLSDSFKASSKPLAAVTPRVRVTLSLCFTETHVPLVQRQANDALHSAENKIRAGFNSLAYALFLRGTILDWGANKLMHARYEHTGKR
ncbi:uncharacterized protein EV420DRAFT_1643363 [Desarmillaria tabescens]|uniref:Uncharacterized protein n=1 Tax=Armillaria tabescens TaxID=1929756 RepID=A0AA39KBC6_ARMTA|nr:uncharacterized protein EV420DRAFT_1643363 [Desarmillaria tabescens]KAK0458016.1 hypothetical protein EV420DRAFT_1643363 [Desarmillaria tabescens]